MTLPSLPAGVIESPPEYAPVAGVLFAYIGREPPTAVLDCIVALTSDPRYDEIAFVLVQDSTQELSAAESFQAASADMSKVRFIQAAAESIWMRDYGPHFIWLDGAMGIVDSDYYPGRPNDNFVPTVLGDDHLAVPTFDLGLYHSGGDFQAGPGRSGFVTSLINLDNPADAGFSEEFIAELFKDYMGIDTLHVMPMLPFSVDKTGHIDMWMYLVDEDSVIISEFKPGSDETAIAITTNAVAYMEDLGFEVYRTPAWNADDIHYTYTNGFRVNNRILVPVYGEGDPEYLDDDAAALAAWQAAAGPGVEIIGIDSYSIIPLAGALHCVVKQVPRYTRQVPSVHLLGPAGGELLVSGTQETIEWTATDTDNRTILQVDLSYSTDGGSTYEPIATTGDTGSYSWTVPEVLTDSARLKVVATAADSDRAEAVSAADFTIAPALQTVYDFATAHGTDMAAFGYRTRDWSFVDGTRTPVRRRINSVFNRAYAKLAYSDGTQGAFDPHRYRSPFPGRRRYSTHTFTITVNEDPSEIDDVAITWEGYAEDCTQMELYVWDDTEQQWGSGSGRFGQNRFMDNWAGNRDAVLGGHIRSHFQRYIDPNGQMTLLVYAERTRSRTFHDYVAVTVSRISR